MGIFGKSLKSWRKEFEKSGKWHSFELVRESTDGWIVEVGTSNISLTMELCRDGSAHIFDTHGPEIHRHIQQIVDFPVKNKSKD